MIPHGLAILAAALFAAPEVSSRALPTATSPRTPRVAGARSGGATVSRGQSTAPRRAGSKNDDVASPEPSEAPDAVTRERNEFGAEGLGVTLGRETRTRVKSPIDGSTNLGLSLGGSVFLSDAATSLLASAGLRARSISGQFPGAEGGTLSALDLAAEVGLLFGVQSFDTPSFSSVALRRAAVLESGYTPPDGEAVGADGGEGASDASALAMLRAQAELCYLWTKFEPMNPETLEQGGFGFRVGLSVGATFVEGGDVSPSIGPVIGLEFPEYNAGTATFSSESVTALVVPVAGAISFSVAYSATF
jgi:hypothetical protein